MCRDLRSASRENLRLANRVAALVPCLPIYPAPSDDERIFEVLRAGSGRA